MFKRVYITIMLMKQNSKLIEDQNIKIIIQSENEKEICTVSSQFF